VANSFCVSYKTLNDIKISKHKRENVYNIEGIDPMLNKWGCHAAVLTESNCIYVLGGMNFTEKIMRRCEKYSLIFKKWIPV